MLIFICILLIIIMLDDNYRTKSIMKEGGIALPPSGTSLFLQYMYQLHEI